MLNLYHTHTLMQRSLPGKNILLFLNEEPAQVLPQQPVRKGRSAELVSRRNEKIADRLYFYRVFGKLEHDTVLRILSAEIDLAAFTIAEIVIEQNDYIKRLKSTGVTIKALKDKWPYMNWNDPHAIWLIG